MNISQLLDDLKARFPDTQGRPQIRAWMFEVCELVKQRLPAQAVGGLDRAKRYWIDGTESEVSLAEYSRAIWSTIDNLETSGRDDQTDAGLRLVLFLLDVDFLSSQNEIREYIDWFFEFSEILGLPERDNLALLMKHSDE